ncbi:selenide, water dikinase SelD [Microbulbifer sp.]|uniref:selenide, water dikinase SelD n=1 Tax=Microbulbifer sp. TaxID=1908541 RepID=UPI00258F601A|nr:selenide, water dikinase SelD [Microbulbifer sp.]
MQEPPQQRDIVLIGGGHSHVTLLQKWARKPLPGARLTLISPQIQSAYSGMLPGMVAGHYGYSDIHIDLPRLCRAAGARFIQACAHQLHPDQRLVSLLGRPDLPFDLLSLDVGATPDRSITGSELSIPVKPIGHFHRYWQQLKQQLFDQHAPFKLGIVGGGVGGCELAMAMAWALEEPVYSGRVEIHLLQGSKKIPPELPLLARQLLARELTRLNIRVHRNWRVSEITHRGVHSEQGQFLALDKALLCTEAAAPPWLAVSGLALDDDGFVLVDDHLRVSGKPYIFASGDLASFARGPVPKSAACAVRQGELLYRNLCVTLQRCPRQKLAAFRPPRKPVTLISCGNQRTLASHSGIAAVGEVLWRWKDYRNRRFLQRFNELPVPPPPYAPSPMAQSPALHHLAPQMAPSRWLQEVTDDGPNPADGATAIVVPEGKRLLQHISMMRSPVADPWLYGRLCALNALSGSFASGAQPGEARALVTLSGAMPELARWDMQQLLDGAERELRHHECPLVDTHTCEGHELQLALTVNGFAEPAKSHTGQAARPGDCLILTKPLGNGTLFAAERQGHARARWIQQSLEYMLQSNATAAGIFHRHHATAVASIGSSGLLGHLLPLLSAPSVQSGSPELDHCHQASRGATLFADALPILPGAACTLDQGWLAPAHRDNLRYLTALQNAVAWEIDPTLQLLADPQVCGGLLASVPAVQVAPCLAALHAAGCRQAAVVGFVDALPTTPDPLDETLQPVYLSQSGDWRAMAARYLETTS